MCTQKQNTMNIRLYINLITTNIYNYVIHIHFLKEDTKIMLHSNTHSNITAPFSFLVSSDT